MVPFKRKVLHLGGFDPRGARFYHQLLGEQIATTNRIAQEQGEPLRLELSPRRRLAKDSGWDVTRSDGACHTEIQFLTWDDLVRLHWVKGALSLVGHMLVTYWYFLTQGRWGETATVPRGSKIALIHPGITLTRLPLLCTLALWLILGLAFHAIHWPALLALIPAAAIGIALGLALVEKSHSLWLLRFIIFNDMLARGRTAPALEERLDEFAATISAALDEAAAGLWDEVLFVTHSNGSILAVPIMARLIALSTKAGRGPVLPDKFTLVTLGSSIQLVGFRRDAKAYHVLLDQMAGAQFRWLDIGSLTDGASIPLVNPCLTRPVAPPAGLIQLSPRWHRYCDPATYVARRADKYLIHFDYLRRLDRPSPLDYIGLTSAPRPLTASIRAFETENA
jgi:hypothetical protein